MHRFSRVLIAVVLCAAAVFTTAAAVGEYTRVVLVDKDNAVLFSQSVRVGDEIVLQFTHSYARSLVEEVFVVTGPAEFTLRETIYEDFGAGLPHEAEPGQTMTFGDGKIRITGFDVRFTDLRVRVGHIADHHVRIGDSTVVRLADLARPGGEVGIVVAQ